MERGGAGRTIYSSEFFELLALSIRPRPSGLAMVNMLEALTTGTMPSWDAWMITMVLAFPLLGYVCGKSLMAFMRFVVRELVREAHKEWIQPLQVLQTSLEDTIANLAGKTDISSRFETLENQISALQASMPSQFQALEDALSALGVLMEGTPMMASFKALEDAVNGFATQLDPKMLTLETKLEPLADLLSNLKSMEMAVTALAVRFDPLDDLHAAVMKAITDKGTSSGTTSTNVPDEIQKILDMVSSLQKVSEMTASKIHDVGATMAALNTRLPAVPSKAKEIWDELQPLLEKWSKDTLAGSGGGTVPDGASGELLTALRDSCDKTVNRVDTVNANIVAKVESVLGFSRDAHALLVRLKDRSEEISKDQTNSKSAVLAAIKDLTPMVRHGRDLAKSASDYATEMHHVVEESEKNIRWACAQEEEILAHTRKVESLCSGLVDQLGEISVQMEKQSEQVATRLRSLHEIQSALDRLMGTVATLTPRTVPAPRVTPPNLSQDAGMAQAHFTPPPPRHAPSLFGPLRDPASTPVILTDARGLLNALQGNN